MLLLHCRTYSYCSQGHAVTEARNKLLLQPGTYSYSSLGHCYCCLDHSYCMQPGTCSCCKLKHLVTAVWDMQLLRPGTRSYSKRKHAVTAVTNQVTTAQKLLQSGTKLQQHGTEASAVRNQVTTARNRGCCSQEPSYNSTEQRLLQLGTNSCCCRRPTIHFTGTTSVLICVMKGNQLCRVFSLSALNR